MSLYGNYSVRKEAYAVLRKLSQNFEDFLVIYGDLFSSDRLAFMRTMGRLEKFLSGFEAQRQGNPRKQKPSCGL